MRKLPRYILIFVLFFSVVTLTTCTKKQPDDINKKISDNIAQSGKDVRLALDILGMWTLEKTQDVTGEVENLKDSFYVAYMADGHIVNVDGEQREEVDKEDMQEIMDTAGYYNSTGDYDNEYRIQDGTIFIYDKEEMKKGADAQPIDTLNIISLENDELLVSSEDEKVIFTFRQVFSWPFVTHENLKPDLKETSVSSESVVEELKEMYTEEGSIKD